ncbi:hypothetical protein R1sor_025267 [Riccia sorocarpa]|uniref:UDP-N-acetylmuramate dehydrogenase n=1 Tax=Riccia sorocarpa TaxID=122646 RepID=A0ABD3GDU4_9MARC
MAGCEFYFNCRLSPGGTDSKLNFTSKDGGSSVRFQRQRLSFKVRGTFRNDGFQETLPLPSSFLQGKRLSELSTFGIGGPAKYFVEVHDESEMSAVIRFCQQEDIRYFIVGKGSNCLFDDRGFDGCVILSSLKFLESDGRGVYRVGSGYPFNMLGIQASNDGFAGLEFASGIPGTVGGAVYMNASANGQETADVLKTVEVLRVDGKREVHIRADSNLVYGYRLSPYQTMDGLAAILAATFRLKPCAGARQRHRGFLERRRKTQPIAAKSAGCVFRNPGSGCESAGALIEKAGLKGAAVGLAKVSDVHANYLVNAGGSTAADMMSLIELVKSQVKDKFGVDLREEVICVPYRSR